MIKLISACVLATSSVIGTAFAVNAATLNTSGDFYSFYGDGFSSNEKALVDELYTNIQPFLGTGGKNNAIAAGFRPFSMPLKGHGEHWFLPGDILADAVAAQPTGLNFDDDGNLVAVFWTETKYQLPDVLSLGAIDPTGLSPETLVPLYQAFKANSLLDTPDALEVFGDRVDWHSHENTVFRNLGSLNPNEIEFTQSVSDENFVAALLEAIGDDAIVAAPFEQDPGLGYPPFNSLIVPGFYMAHLWLGLGNPMGPFANIHPDVSPNAIEERLTFEDGMGDHDHGHDHGGNPVASVPDPDSTAGLLALFVVGSGLVLKRRFGIGSTDKQTLYW